MLGKQDMHPTNCPHCGKPASPLGLMRYTQWTGYRCSACHKKSRFDLRATASAGGLGALIGAFAQSMLHFHGASRLLAVVVLTLLFVVGMSLFMTLRPVEE
jgi:transposase-like protein